jgi:signal peptidase I
MTTEIAAARPPGRLGSAAREVLDAATHLAVVVAVFIAVQFLVFKPFTIPSSSMEPGLETGDYVIVTSFDYGWSRAALPFAAPLFHGRLFGRPARRGDVVVFRLPRDPATTYVKRLIGLPGDRIQMREGRLYINDTMVPRRAIGRFDGDRRYVETLPSGREHEIIEISDADRHDDTPVFIVPVRHYFMMGDNRDNSLDSRIPAAEGGVGFVPEENLVARVDRLLFSLDPSVGWRDVADWPHAFRLARLFGRIE